MLSRKDLAKELRELVISCKLEDREEFYRRVLIALMGYCESFDGENCRRAADAMEEIQTWAMITNDPSLGMKNIADGLEGLRYKLPEFVEEHLPPFLDAMEYVIEGGSFERRVSEDSRKEALESAKKLVVEDVTSLYQRGDEPESEF